MNRITPFGTENFVIVPTIFLSKLLVPKFIACRPDQATRECAAVFGTENFVIVPIIFLSKLLVPKLLKILKSLFRLPPECPMAHSKGGGKRKILIQTRES